MRRDRKPRVRWAHFHDIETLSPEEGGGALPPREDVGMMPLPAGPSPPGGLAAILEGAGPSVAPESHGAIRSVEQRQRMWASSSESAEVRCMGLHWDERGWAGAGRLVLA